MKASEVLQAMVDEPRLIGDVIGYLNRGMWNEWDTSLEGGSKLGFGLVELAVAAKSGLALAKFHEDRQS